jgi:hypothetical protein
MDGKTCTFSFGKVGTNDVHASASPFCVPKSSLIIEAAVRSERNDKYQYLQAQRRFCPTSFEMTVCVGDVRAEHDFIEESVGSLVRAV